MNSTVSPVPYLDLPAQIRSIRKELDAVISRTLDNCSFCLGPDVQQFEKDFAKYCGAQFGIGFNSGTSALHVALLLLNIGPGDEVITTPFTFVATSWAISYVGAKPVYVDIEDSTFNLDPKLIEGAITPRTKAIMPVHLYGHPFDVDPILAICRKHKLPLVEDAAQAHGATYKGKIVGTFGEMAGFSFYPGKNLGACGEGGALVTNNADLVTRAKALREHGSTVRYYHDEVGYNYRMEGIQGAVLGVKLKYLDRWTAGRRRVAKLYAELLADTPLQLPREADYAESAWHLYVVRHPQRNELKKFLETNSVGCALHYPEPLHLQKAYQHLGHKAGDFPFAEKAASECLSLPI
jgi:dTDP-4-amino-4,6-dideoxygalactose transaminase